MSKISKIFARQIFDSRGNPTVEVDGTEVSDWTYNMIENSVDFMGGYVPEAGTEIEISYSVLADCDL